MAAPILAHAAVTAAKSKTGQRIIGGAIAVAVAIMFTIGMLPVAMITMFSGSNQESGGCGGTDVSVESGTKIAGYGEKQLAIAATIISVGQAMKVPLHGQQIAVMTGMGESSLQNLDHGDAVDNSTIGVFQQGSTYGPREDRMNVPKAAAAFYTRLLKVKNWQKLEPTIAAHKVQINADKNHYTRFFVPAGEVLAGLTKSGAGTACETTVPGDQRAAALALVVAIKDKRLVFSKPAHRKQIEAYANMKDKQPSCFVDLRVMQTILLALQLFKTVGVSSVNRACTSETPGAGKASYHWKGLAVDFYAFGGSSTNGADSNAIKLIKALDSVANSGAGVGQSDCRAARGVSVKTSTLKQFFDKCHHLHFQVGNNAEPFKSPTK